MAYPQWIEVDGITKKPIECNFEDRGDQEVDAVVLHYTAGASALSSWKWFNTPKSSASAHFIVDRDGSILQCVPLDMKAYHVGRDANLAGSKSANSKSIGIEISNFGLLVTYKKQLCTIDDKEFIPYDSAKYGEPVYGAIALGDPTPQHILDGEQPAAFFEGYWEPYKPAQILSVHKLVRLLREGIEEIASSKILGHSDIALPLGRKQDPGPLWDWFGMFALLGIPYDVGLKNHKSVSFIGCEAVTNVRSAMLNSPDLLALTENKTSELPPKSDT